MDLLKLKSGSDVRGVALGDNASLTPDVARSLGLAFVKWLSEKTGKPENALSVSLGRDSRLTGESLLRAAAEGIFIGGAKPVSLGMCTTPAMFMSTITEGFDFDGAVMITASHHPFDRNGLKFFTKDGGVESEDIETLLRMAGEYALASHPDMVLKQSAFLPVYCAHLKTRILKGLDTDVAKPLLGLHVVVDAGNGAGGFYAAFLEELGAWAEGSQFLEPDGRFPNHIPNPENEGAMESISKAVIAAGADLGVIFDADCDRAAIVDEKGRPINRNRLIALISAVLLDAKSGGTIVTDSVTSSGLTEFINAWGGVHFRYKRGYRNVIDEAVRLNAEGIDCPLAIETSGHAALRENYFLDDGMYLVTVLLSEAMKRKQAGQRLCDLIADLREPVEALELRLNILTEDFKATGHEAINRVLDAASHDPALCIATDSREGVRIYFDLDGKHQSGWYMMRLSVHDPVLPINVESDVEGGCKLMLSSLKNVLEGMSGIDFSPIDKACK